MAAKALTHFPENEDLLMVLADYALQKNQTDRAYSYASRLVTVMSRHPKPEGMPAADVGEEVHRVS